jgi:hypothetical protein
LRAQPAPEALAHRWGNRAPNGWSLAFPYPQSE